MPYRRLNIPTFNQQSIDNWHIGVTTLPDKIAQENLRLQESTLRLLQAQHQLKEFRTTSIRPVETTILGLTSRIKVLTLPAVIQQKKDYLVGLKARSAELHLAIQGLESELTPVNHKIEQLTRLIHIKGYEPQIESLKNRLKIIQESNRSFQQQLQTVDQQSVAVSSQLFEAKERLSRLRHQQSLDAMGHAMQDRYRQPSHHHHHNHNGIGNIIHVVGDVACNMAFLSEQTTVNRLQSEYNIISQNTLSLRTSLAAMHREENEISSQTNRLEDNVLRLKSSISDPRSYESIDNLKRELNTETGRKNVLSRQKDAVTQQLAPIVAKIQELNTEIPLFNAEYEKAKLNSVFYARYDDVSLLEQNLIKEQATQRDLKNQEAEILASVGSAQTVTSGLQRSIQANENQLAEFLKDKWRRQVHEQPSVIIEQLSTAIRELHARASSRVVQQSSEMQLFLAESSNKLNVILNLQTQDPLKEGRKAYYQLGGMIWTLLDKLADSSTLDSTFLDEMDRILKQHPLDCREAQEVYRLLKHAYPQELQDMNFGDIMALRVVEYDAISQNLSNSLDQIPNNSPKAWLTLRDSAHDILDAVALQKDQLGGVKERLLNLQFCIQVLNTTQQLVNNPDNPQCQDDFLTLMRANKEGQPSRVKKIVGAMLMFFGAVTALVSLGLVVGTFGFAAPIATFGGGAGAGLLLGGLGLFANGREKGMAKKMANFHLAADNAQGIPNPHSLFANPVPVMGVIAVEAPQEQGRDPK